MKDLEQSRYTLQPNAFFPGSKLLFFLNLSNDYKDQAMR